MPSLSTKFSLIYYSTNVGTSVGTNVGAVQNKIGPNKILLIFQTLRATHASLTPRNPRPATRHDPRQSDGIASTEDADEYLELSLAVLDQSLFVPVAYALLDVCPRTSSTV